MLYRCEFRQRRSIRRPRFPIRVQNFSDLATFSVVFFCILCWMSAIFLLPVCLTYWPRKYTTRVDPHVDYFRQVWSWYDHTLPSYSVFVCQHITWPWPLIFWSWTYDMHGESRDQHCHQVWRPYAYPFLSYDLYNVCRLLPLKIRTRLLRMRRITWPVSRGQKQFHFFVFSTPFCLFTMQLRWLCDESN